MSEAENGGITLRELNQKLHHERELIEQQLKALDRSIAEHAGVAQRALELQAKEYERRLAELQHSHNNSHILTIVMWAIVLCCLLLLIALTRGGVGV